MAEKPQEIMKTKTAPKEVSVPDGKGDKIAPRVDDNRVTKSPNSTAPTKRRTAETVSNTAKGGKKMMPKKANIEANNAIRLDSIENTIKMQTEQNKQFQNNILTALSAMSGMMDHEDDDASSVSSEISTGGILKQGNPLAHACASTSKASSEDHPISDSEDDKPEQQGPIQANEAEVQPDDNDDLGFAARFALDLDEGPPIGNDIAKALMHEMTYKLKETELKDAMERHKCPSNCHSLQIPSINMPIWKEIPNKAKSRDLKFQRIQRPLIKGLTALAKAMGQNPLSQDGEDGITLVANAAFELNCLRKEMLKPDLNAQYLNICKPPVFNASRKYKSKPKSYSREYYSLLFGDELGKNLEDLQKESKATSSMFRFGNRATNRPKPYFVPAAVHSRNANRQNFRAAMAAAGWSGAGKPFLGVKRFQNRRHNMIFHNRNQAKKSTFAQNSINPSSNQNKN